MKRKAVILFSLGLLGSLVVLEFVCIKFSLFEILPNIGTLFHTLGGIFCSILISQFFLHPLEPVSNLVKGIFVLGVVSLLVVGWELFEWTFGYMLVHNNMQGTLDDTMLDLLVGILASFLGLIIQKILDRFMESRFFL